MHKFTLAVAALVAFALTAPAHAIVQETNTTVTKTGTEIETAKITIEQPGRPPQTVTVSKGKPSTSKPIKIDTDKPVKVTTEINGKVDPNRERTLDGSVFIRDGVSLGSGLTLQSTPTTATRTRLVTSRGTPPPTSGPYDAVLFQVPSSDVAFDVGVTGVVNFNPRRPTPRRSWRQYRLRWRAAQYLAGRSWPALVPDNGRQRAGRFLEHREGVRGQHDSAR
jgi:archaellum component FlaG (FlaF/FlaG flagellin family)